MTPTSTRVERRRAQARQEILDAAARRTRQHGLGGLSLRALADEVGLTAPSLYSYFPSKDAILDALFAEGYRELTRRLELLERTGDPHTDLTAGVQVFLAFCTEDIPRYQLLFTAALPGWKPSAEAYAPSVASLDQTRGLLASFGVTDPADLDLFTALTSGLAAQQNANDPGGDRWTRLTADAMTMFLDHVEVHP